VSIALADEAASRRAARRLRPTAPVALIGLAALAPLGLGAGAGVLDDMVLAATFVVMALGLNIVVGFAGLLDLGYVAFFAIGAYTAAYFASGFWANAGPVISAEQRKTRGPETLAPLTMPTPPPTNLVESEQ